jgi:hypothetical protein
MNEPEFESHYKLDGAVLCRRQQRSGNPSGRRKKEHSADETS